MTHQKGRTHERKTKQRLQPGQNIGLTDSKRINGREIPGESHKNREGGLAAKRCQALRRIQHAMCQLPVQICDLTVNVKKREGSPRGGPIEWAEGERKLINAMRLDHILGKKVQITRLGRHTRHRSADQRQANTESQEIMGGRKGTIKALPGGQERRIKRRQDSRVVRKRPREHGNRGNTERR